MFCELNIGRTDKKKKEKKENERTNNQTKNYTNKTKIMIQSFMLYANKFTIKVWLIKKLFFFSANAVMWWWNYGAK